MVTDTFQRKYVLGILKETRMLDCKLVDTFMGPNVTLLPNQKEPYLNLGKYGRLFGKLYYLTMTRLDIVSHVCVVSQFLNTPSDGQRNLVAQILIYIKRSPGTEIVYKDRVHANFN